MQVTYGADIGMKPLTGKPLKEGHFERLPFVVTGHGPETSVERHAERTRQGKLIVVLRDSLIEYCVPGTHPPKPRMHKMPATA